ncbi:MAG: RNHCP domain-containing protein [Candidatus Doudnabacteria bacterium]
MKVFQRRKENFVCGYCGYKITGTGYTNHCPKCLFSKHVDINPGDRAEICQGLMEPIGIGQEHNEFTILHKCIKCGAIRKNKTVKEDDFDLIVKLTQ